MGLYRWVNGINCQRAYEAEGLFIDEKGFICALDCDDEEENEVGDFHEEMSNGIQAINHDCFHQNRKFGKENYDKFPNVKKKGYMTRRRGK